MSAFAAAAAAAAVVETKRFSDFGTFGALLSAV